MTKKLVSPSKKIPKKALKKVSKNAGKAVKKAPKKKTSKKKKTTTKLFKQFAPLKALAFAATVPLPKLPPQQLGIAEEKKVPYTEGVDQSLVVGADVVSFAKELPASQRSIVTNSLLLAQLAADAKVKDKTKVKEWYNAYFETLGKLGWLAQSSGFSEEKKKGADFEVHEAIISVATAAFGPAGTALTLVVTTLNAMKKVGDNAPWMTVFKRSAQSSKVARFQVTTAEPASNGGTMIFTMAFELGTKNQLTQVLFFKFKSADVRFWHASGKVTLEKSRAETLAPVIEKKVSAYLVQNVEEIILE